MTYKDIKSCFFNKIIEKLYHYKTKTHEALEQAIESKKITRIQAERLLKDIGLQDVDFEYDNEFNRKMKLNSLAAIEFLCDFVSGKNNKGETTKYSAIRVEAAITLLDYYFKKVRPMRNKDSQVNITVIDSKEVPDMET